MKNASGIMCLFLVAVAMLFTGCAPLRMAAAEGDIKGVERFIAEGADVNEKSIRGETSLHFAAFNGHKDIVRLLIEKGADVNAKDVNGANPLSYAVFNGREDIARFLIEKGADVDVALSILESSGARGQKGGQTGLALLQNIAKESEIAKLPTLARPAQPQQTEQAPLVKSDVDELPNIKTQPNKNAYAIVIGIESYRQKLPKADYAAHDAQTMTEYLTKVMGYPEENVVTLINDRAALGDVIKYFEKWLPNNVEKDGTVFVYYSGHGAPDTKTGGAFLVPYDGDPSFINETGYSLKRLYDALGKLQTNNIVVALDSCFSGAGGKSVIAKGARPMVITLEHDANIARNMTVMAASSGDEISSTYEEKGHGLFTYYLLKGLKGEGDANDDGRIEIGELFDYLKPQVGRTARKVYNNDQSPQLIGGGERRAVFLM